MKSIYNNVYVLTFPQLYAQINKKYKLGYDLLRLKNNQLSDLLGKARKAIEQIIEQLPDCNHIIAKGSDSIFWIHEHNVQLGTIHSDYQYTLNVYPKGIVISSKRYALWDGKSVIYGNSIMNRPDIAPICKVLFNNSILRHFNGAEILCDAKGLPINDYVFDTLAGKKIIGADGYLTKFENDSDINMAQYTYWTSQKLKKWLQ